MIFSDLLHPAVISYFFLGITFFSLVLWGVIPIWGSIAHQKKSTKDRRDNSITHFLLLVAGSLLGGIAFGALLQYMSIMLTILSLTLFVWFTYFSIFLFFISLILIRRLFLSWTQKEYPKKWMLIIAFIFVFCCGFLSSMMYSTLHASGLDQMHRRQAEQIVEALKKYKNDKGGFPHDLSQLSGQYISQSFLTTEKWMYFSNSPDGFRLEYDAQSNFFTYGYSQNGSKSGWYDWNSM